MRARRESYSSDTMDKKHEDVGAVAQIDKTSVFQEGMIANIPRAAGGGHLGTFGFKSHG